MKLHRILAMIGAVLILPILCLPAFAAENQGILCLRCSTLINGDRYYFSGDEFSLAKIADAEVIEDAQSIRYTTLPEYKAYDCDWSALNAEDSCIKAKELAKIAVRKGQYLSSSVVDQQGNVCFSNLDPALYLVVRTKAASQNQNYFVEPFLIRIPMVWENEIVYTVTSAPKFGWKKPDPILPQTGQLNWPVPVLTGLGIAFILVGFGMYKKK